MTAPIIQGTKGGGPALISVICTRIIAAKVAKKFPQRYYKAARVHHTDAPFGRWERTTEDK